MSNLQRISKEKLLSAGYKFLRNREDGGSVNHLQTMQKKKTDYKLEWQYEKTKGLVK